MMLDPKCCQLLHQQRARSKEQWRPVARIFLLDFPMEHLSSYYNAVAALVWDDGFGIRFPHSASPVDAIDPASEQGVWDCRVEWAPPGPNLAIRLEYTVPISPLLKYITEQLTIGTNYHPSMKLREGNISTGVCLSIHRGFPM